MKLSSALVARLSLLAFVAAGVMLAGGPARVARAVDADDPPLPADDEGVRDGGEGIGQGDDGEGPDGDGADGDDRGGPPAFLRGNPKAAKAARELAREVLPAKADLGEDENWLLPWELPEGVLARVESEDQYWEQAAEELIFVGLSDEEAASVVDQFLALGTSDERSGGFGPREAALALLMTLRDQNGSPAVQMSAEMKMLKAFTSAAAAAQRRRPGGAGGDAGGGDDSGGEGEEDGGDEASGDAAVGRAGRQALEAALPELANMSPDQLRDACVKAATLARERTRMSYYKSNNWDGILQALRDGGGGEQELVRRGLWMGAVDVSVTMIPDHRADEVADVGKDRLDAVQAELDGGLRAFISAMDDQRRGQLEAQVEELRRELQNTDDEEQRAGINLQIERVNEEIEEARDEAARATAGLAVSVVPRDYGQDGQGYVIRLTGVSPETAGLKGSAYTGWLRNGAALVKITFRGNLPEEEMTKAMDVMLAKMDVLTSGAALDLDLDGLDE